ncbi:phosphatidylinositol/phosphatidylcholine transfer protein SFH13-like isoform X1 [Macadamia integrifolia]|uniref:phosphatidylinositol/phosphatidylcholine transfer protein SFH13-like isoform X1 n=1 Tax=Macadamia integrifolia TaxID=60698 RepID=UPI001C4FB445|nr:phosphatidylinositol/phosphatidylcholine transfer protein SFH13-like isoform X1 [Macadamia integrifolia]
MELFNWLARIMDVQFRRNLFYKSASYVMQRVHFHSMSWDFEFEELEEVLQHYRQGCHGVDKDGRPISRFLGKHDLWRDESQCIHHPNRITHITTVDCYLSIMYRSLRRHCLRNFLHVQLQQWHIGSTTTILDVQDLMDDLYNISSGFYRMIYAFDRKADPSGDVPI